MRFSIESLNNSLGVPTCGHANFLVIGERAPYCDIWKSFCGVTSFSRFDRVRDTVHHLSLHCGHLNWDSQVWLKIMCSA